MNFYSADFPNFLYIKLTVSSSAVVVAVLSKLSAFDDSSLLFPSSCLADCPLASSLRSIKFFIIPHF